MARRNRASRELFDDAEWVEYALDWRRTYGFEASVEALQAAFRDPRRRQFLDSDVYFTEAESEEIARVQATFEQRPDVQRWLPADAVERHFIDMEFDRRPPGGLWSLAFTHRAEEYVELLREHYPDPSKLVAATRPYTARALNRVEAEVRAAENEIGREIWEISTAPMEGVVRVELDSDDHRYCGMAGGSLAGAQRCALPALQIGYGNNRPYKSVMKFDINRAIPSYATATAARFLAWQFPNSTSKAPVSSRLRTVTREWDETATFDVAKTGATSATTTPWTTKGGDTSTDPNLTGPAITVGPSGYWSYWPAPVAAVNGWIKGTLPNYGFQISTETTYPSVINAYEFTSTKGNQESWPALEVTWVPDTTAPDPITGLRVASYGGAGNATIAWDSPSDPPLANGTPGSGIASQSLAVTVNGVARPVISAPEGAAEISGLATGNALQLTLTVTDQAGNVRTASLSVPSLQPLLDDPAVDSAAANAYQAEFGGTRAQAEGWIAAQNTVSASNSGNVIDAVKNAATASGYGGVYFDNASRQFVARLTSSANQNAVTGVLNALGVSYRTEAATVTADRLRNVQSDLEDQLLDLLNVGKVRISAAESTGTIQVIISDQVTTAENTRIRSQTTGGIPTTYVTEAGLLQGQSAACNPFDCFAPQAARGGVLINLGIPGRARFDCTLGFIVKRNNGQRAGLTAGHCVGEPANQTVLYGRYEERPLGTVSNVSDVTFSAQGDFALFNVSSDTTQSVVVMKGQQTTANPRYPIRGAAPNVEGHWTCFTGATTYTTSCGRVTSRVGEVTYSDDGGITVTGLAVNTACPQKGDSGGPVFKAGYAYGVVSGFLRKNGNCVHGYYTGAKTIESIESQSGLTFTP